MALSVGSGTVAGDPQSPNFSEPEIKKDANPGFMHWFNKNMNRLQVEYMSLNEKDFMKWCDEQWKK